MSGLRSTFALPLTQCPLTLPPVSDAPHSRLCAAEHAHQYPPHTPSNAPHDDTAGRSEAGNSLSWRLTCLDLCRVPVTQGRQNVVRESNPLRRIAETVFDLAQQIILCLTDRERRGGRLVNARPIVRLSGNDSEGLCLILVIACPLGAFLLAVRAVLVFIPAVKALADKAV